MTAALALGANGAVYSIQRHRNASHVVHHTASAATSLYAARDLMRALWVSPNGVIHAAGIAHHTNLGGAWRTTKPKAGGVLALWGAADDDVFAGSVEGAVLRFQGEAWVTLGEHDDMICGIHGTSASNVVVVGDGAMFRFDGETLAKVAPPKGERTLQGVYCAGDDVWLCGTGAVYRNGQKVAELERSSGDELYAVGVGTAGVFAQGPAQVYEAKAKKLVAIAGLESALVAKRAEYSTSMACDGTRVVAGGATSVLVNDGEGFVAWPGL